MFSFAFFVGVPNAASKLNLYGVVVEIGGKLVSAPTVIVLVQRGSFRFAKKSICLRSKIMQGLMLPSMRFGIDELGSSKT